VTRIILLGLAGLLVLCGGTAGAEDNTKRIAYVVKYGSARDLAKVLGAHLKGAAEVEALPEPSANVLLIRSSPAAFEEVVKLLETLDRRPRVVEVELWVAEVVPGRKVGDREPEPLDTRELGGPADNVLKRVEDLRKAGRLGEFKRLQLTAVENQPAKAHVGESKPLTSAINVTGTGRVARSVYYRNFGTQLNVTPHVGVHNVVALDLKVEDARPHVAEDAPLLGKDENNNPIRATESVQSVVEGRVCVPSGEAVVVQGVKVTAKTGQAQTLMIVTARVLDGKAK
jgi:type II secretory pathway component GspD/PulD (secretin)